MCWPGRTSPERLPCNAQAARSRHVRGRARCRWASRTSSTATISRPLRLADLQDTAVADAATVRWRATPAPSARQDVTTEFGHRHPDRPAIRTIRRTRRRFLIGLGGSRRRLSGDARHRHADRRLGDPARRLRGVVAYKPTYGHFRRRMKANTERLDTIGAYAPASRHRAIRAALMAIRIGRSPAGDARASRLLHAAQG